MRIGSAVSTSLFAGTPQRPMQIVRVTLVNDRPGQAGEQAGPVLVRVEGPGVATPVPFGISGIAAGGHAEAQVPVLVAAPHGPGSRLPVTVIAETAARRCEDRAEIIVAEPGWTMWMVSHFHYDPVWWNTQGQFTEARLLLPGEDGELPEVRTAFELVRLHLDAARTDPDYKFVLAEIDYLKPHFDAHPEDRADLLRLIAEGRIEIVGGNYNEPNTNLTSAESTIRNAVYGIGYQRDVIGGDIRAAWMLDAFGHDPGYPGLMAAAGLTDSAWARGPFHQWGPQRTVGDNKRMQFPSEFEWVSPDGAGLLTAYMPNHYGAGWATHHAPDLAGAEREAMAQFEALAPVAATRNVLLPVGADHVIPCRWATEIHRDWNARYVWPRFVTALPREFFAAVRADAARRDLWLTPQTRDMNPVYPGKDVSYIDTKQAQRAGETAVLDGERLGTLAWLAGAPYPAESLDKAWRQLVYGAHHDAITGTESDQVYLDLLGGWREAHERGDRARLDAAAYLARRADTRPPWAGPRHPGPPGAGPGEPLRAVAVFNTLSWPRSGLASIRLEFAAPGPPWLDLRDQSGSGLAFLADGVRRHPDGTLAAVGLTFRAADVPAVGYRTFWVTASALAAEASAAWQAQPGAVIQNEAFLVEADAARGGTLSRITDKRSGTEVLRGLGNELMLQEEYDYHPRWGEGPWLLSPKGPGTGSAGTSAKVTAQRCPLGRRLVTEFSLGDMRVTQETLLWDGADRVTFRTHVDGSIGMDRLLRVRFPARVPGGLPLYQGATAVIGRPFGEAGTDVAEHSFTMDNPAHEWFGLGSTARVEMASPHGGRRSCAIGVAEVILPAPARGGQALAPGRAHPPSLPGDLRRAVRQLVVSLAARGVTATCSPADGPRYGAVDLDSNLPDVRIALGGPEHNPWTARLLEEAGPEFAAAAAAGLAASGAARVWVPASRSRELVFAPGADVRGSRDLPVLIVAGRDLAAAVASVAEDLGDSVIEAVVPAGAGPEPALAHYSVALLNRGTPGSLVSPDGALHIALMRSCSAWPSGVWIDGEKRTAPDGSSFAWQHWSHTFEYALTAGPGDWRDVGFPAAGQDYNHDLLACETGLHAGPAAPVASLCSVLPSHSVLPAGAAAGQLAAAGPPAMLAALKPRGNPLASGRRGEPQREDGVIVRLRDAGGQTAGGGLARLELRLSGGISAAVVTDLLEEAEGAALPVEGGAVIAEVPPAGTLTLALALSPQASPVPAVPEPASPKPAVPEPAVPEPAQPVFTRYWLHGKGPAPAGNLPVAVHLSPARIALLGPAAGPAGSRLAGSGAAGPGTDDSGTARGELPEGAQVRLTVAAGPEPASGAAELDVPSGLMVHPAGPFRFQLPGRGHALWDLTVRGLPGAASGHYFLAARIRDDLGQILEDVTMVTLGQPAPPALDLPLDELLPLLDADQRAIAGEIDAEMLTRALSLPPGGQGELAVRVANRAASAIRGEAQLLSPFGSWAAACPWTQGFAVSTGQDITLRYHVRVPADARLGTQWWMLVKLMYFGRLCYTDCVSVLITK
jgi:alpha-mannosidase